MAWFRTALGFGLGILIWAWVKTLRIQGAGLPDGAAPRVFAFWHGSQMALLAGPRQRPIQALVSWSQDGSLQAGVMRALGFSVVRGSSSRGGSQGLRGLLRGLARADVALAVDGPRGPAGVAKPGALAVARLGGAQLVPVAAACERAWVLERTWDRFQIPLPFSRLVVVCGDAFPPDELPLHAEDLGLALRACERSAERQLAALTGRRLGVTGAAK